MIELLEEVAAYQQTWSLWRDISDKAADYKDLFSALRAASERDIIIIDIECPGGSCDVGFRIYDHIQTCAGQVHMVVSGPCYSMGALLALAGDSMSMYEDTFLMFHTFSYGVFPAKSGDIEMDVKHTTKMYKSRIDKICQPFLSAVELKRVHEGKDLYICADDKSLNRRIKRTFKEIKND